MAAMESPLVLERTHAILITLAIAVAAYLLATPKARPLPDIPWVGKSSRLPGADTWATLASFVNRRKWFAEGYEKYSRHGKSFIVPHPLGEKHITLPPEKLSWLLEQPDHVVSAADFHYEILAGRYAWTDGSINQILFHEHVIHKYIVRRDSRLLAGMWDEIGTAVDELWGTSPGWHDIRVLDTSSEMILRVVNRALVGLPLCRNRDYLSHTNSFTTNVLLCTFATQLVPRFLRDIVGYAVGAPNHWHYRRCALWTLPVIRERLGMFAQIDNGSLTADGLPEDYITWHIELARAEGWTRELAPEFIARSLMALEFAATKTPAATLARVLLDVCGSGGQSGYIDRLRDEAEQVFTTHNQTWSKQTLRHMAFTDSAIRESMRLTSLLFALGRKVVPAAGVPGPDKAWVAPQGSYLTINAADRHLDPALYPDPTRYDAFRFARVHEGQETTEDGLQARKMGMTSTSKDFLAFGHGRHACLGRFLVEQMLKMLLAYMLMHYDIEYLPARPPNFVLGPINVPPPKATIKVCRKKTEVE
ncbi:cytochrome P450 monooxygenase gloP [Colletotrichum spaethianum]|uniref:Cytochrome P450 monooxygenase gloP n=1 Tax=Colletotrichum spaethianum TaxID=700344 RepID=A0AA37PCG4_9PEZI|nr:cytochrome P450 monooxygenase gloP [Colletotrichum spaethianum]GKT49662.1 cytochrome P450 monooxygenase gloP [Colletotrichum spaethianum]